METMRDAGVRKNWLHLGNQHADFPPPPIRDGSLAELKGWLLLLLLLTQQF